LQNAKQTEAIASNAAHAHMAATNEYGKSQFSYNEVNDGYIFSQRHLLKAYKPRKENAEYSGHNSHQESAKKASVEE
jgi:hypothetical protein